MSRGSVPPIQPTDLRDVATEERVERIWSRLDQDIAMMRARPPSRPSRAVVWAAAATFVAFGVGLFAGRVAWRGEPVGSSPVVPAPERATTDLFAAGTQERTYPLPGGGTVTLAPGSLVELERTGGSDVRLRLLSGEASLDTAQAPDRGLAIVSGEAVVATAPGSTISVRQRADNLDVRVVGGSAQVSSPAGTQALIKGEQMENVPTRTTVNNAMNPPPVVRVAVNLTKGRVPHNGDPKAAIAVQPSWRELHAQLKDDEAFDALKQQAGGVSGAIASAKSAEDLMALSDVLRFHSHDSAAGITALRRVADEFGATKHGATAAYQLSRIYENSGQPDLAKKYREQTTGVFAANALCDSMRAEQKGGKKAEAAARAKEYLDKYPNGPCKVEAQRIFSGDADEDDDSSADPPASAPATSSGPSSAPSSAPSVAPSAVPTAVPAPQP